MGKTAELIAVNEKLNKGLATARKEMYSMRGKILCLQATIEGMQTTILVLKAELEGADES